MSILRRDNGLNQYTSWENNYPNPPQRWGSGTPYDDSFGSPYLYPGNGVMMGDGYIVASYNALNQPVAMWSFNYQGTPNYVWFGYDPLGRCVKRWVAPVGANGAAPLPTTSTAGTYFYYDAWNLIQEGPATGGYLWNGSSVVQGNASGATRVYLYGARVDEMVTSSNLVTGNYVYAHYDARGHCTMLTDRWTAITEQYDYDAFGFPYFYNASGTNVGSSTWGNRFLFTGREWLSDLKLYDYRARIYQPELGRFLQPDPKQFEAGDYNLYRYCHNDPVNRSDPFGLEFFDLGYRLTDFVKGADYGITQPVLSAPQIIITPVNGGYTASVPKFDLRVQSEIATKARDGQTVFNRAKENIDRTIKHEGDHRGNNRGWYDKNHDKVLKDLNSDKVYKDPAAAKSAVEQKLRNNFENFRKQEDTHTGPNWPNYKRPDREHPGQ